jgi:hypothetical protein
MRAGDLRSRVVLQSMTTSTDAIGNPVKTWSNVSTEWADVQAQDGTEAIQSGQVNARQALVVRIRYRAGVVPTMRLIHAGRPYEIMTVVNVDQRNRELQLACAAGSDS